ncbi:putative C2H2 and C2HC zinc fingers superfamily protein [Hibiscus syriacus]|uniref:C2H2 and C2HC zinc fingers superfamily protein n=1 Tax=Hibiscus syriacus TaxID=106335 RepID=A0A6A2XG67_HIBSY|nr:putative C2H2 and C2HC zinc fingers superfamily protein [Hibiscus syriacus]
MVKVSKYSWPKLIVRKWLNITSGADEFHSDYDINDSKEESPLLFLLQKNLMKEERVVPTRIMFVPEDFSESWLMEVAGGIKPTIISPETLPVSDSINLRMFVGTWNVGGKSPHHGLNLRDWLRSPAPADIYVLGYILALFLFVPIPIVYLDYLLAKLASWFQEIVPLNAGNVLGAEDNGPAVLWLSLIRQALNTNPSDLELAQCYNITSPSSLKLEQHASVKPRVSFFDLLSTEDEIDKEDFEILINLNSGLTEDGSPSPTYVSSSPKQRRFCLAASKQMVGLFLCVWVRADLYQHISNLKVSCVGRGIMGYLGNKYDFAPNHVLLRLYTLDFRGERKRPDPKEFRCFRNLKETRFSHTLRGRKHPLPPHTIFDHDKIIWLGDLNYRLAAGCADTYKLLKKNDWQTLLEKDQLRLEQRAGRVFKGWEEGTIYFAPTYKYLADSDDYVVQTSNSKEKRRIPAWCDRILWKGEGLKQIWCDRILWKGEGLKQIWYSRGESRFSDHRPVYSLFGPIEFRQLSHLHR